MNVSTPHIESQDATRLLRLLLAGGAMLLLWRMLRGIGALLGAAFGIAMALFWSGAWHAFA